jgi:hypothetical protein
MYKTDKLNYIYRTDNIHETNKLNNMISLYERNNNKTEIINKQINNYITYYKEKQNRIMNLRKKLF